jgi:hypothetical protein
MTTLRIEIKMDNAAFEDDAPTEIARILRQYAERLERQHDRILTFDILRDINGNRVGKAEVVP